MQNQARQRHTFSFVAPDALEVLLAGDFTSWDQHPIPLTKAPDGTWTCDALLEPGRHEYRFLIDRKWCDDPTCTIRTPNAFGSENCVCVFSPSQPNRKTPEKKSKSAPKH